MNSWEWGVSPRACAHMSNLFSLFCVRVVLRIELRSLGKHLITDSTPALFSAYYIMGAPLPNTRARIKKTVRGEWKRWMSCSEKLVHKRSKCWVMLSWEAWDGGWKCSLKQELRKYTHWRATRTWVSLKAKLVRLSEEERATWMTGDV